MMLEKSSYKHECGTSSSSDQHTMILRLISVKTSMLNGG